MQEDDYFKFLEFEKLLIEQEINNYLGLLGIKYVLDSRIKSLEKIKIKQEYLKRKGRPCDLTDVYDIVGFRISTETEDDLLLIEAFLEGTIFYTYQMIKFVDFYFKPKDTGYKAFNIFFISHHGIHFEIQLMTENMKKWTNSTHLEHDIRKYGRGG